MYPAGPFYSLHIEPSSYCNAACPMCSRHAGLPQSQITLADLRRILPPEQLGEIRFLSFCGNYGDPATARELWEMCAYVMEHTSPNTSIEVRTNGGARDADWWAKLGALFSARENYRVVFGIDGLEDTNHLYRRKVDWKKLTANFRAFIAAGGNAAWQFIPFRHNEDQIESARDFARAEGFRDFEILPTPRFRRGPDGNLTPFPVTDPEGKLTFLLEPPSNESVHPRPKPVPADPPRITIDCEALRDRSIYISAEQLLFPCCYLAQQAYTPWPRARCDGFAPALAASGGLKALSLAEHSLGEILGGDFFQRALPTAWDAYDNPHQQFKTCEIQCGKCVKDFAAPRHGNAKLHHSENLPPMSPEDR